MFLAKAQAEKTCIEFVAERAAALRDALGMASERETMEKTLELLLQPWGSRRIGAYAKFPSNVADDEAPFEFSVAFSPRSPELQLYVDPQGDPPTPSSNLAAARSRLTVIANELSVPMERLHQVQDLFLPPEPGPPFGLWIGASWASGRNVTFKVYLNPQARGGNRGPELVAEAMGRLGFARAWSRMQAELSLDDGVDELGIVSLDLSRSAGERIKVYVRHHQATVSRIERMARLTGEHGARDIETFYGTLACSHGPFAKKPAATVLAFVDPETDRPAATSLEFPIGSYVKHDEEARERVANCLRTFGLATAPYERAIRTFAARPLDVQGGIHAHVTLRRLTDGPRIAVYLASEAYARPTKET